MTDKANIKSKTIREKNIADMQKFIMKRFDKGEVKETCEMTLAWRGSARKVAGDMK